MLSSEDQATLQAYIEGVDAAAREAEAVWGMDRLPLLIDDELRAKFRRQQVRWSSSIEAAYNADILTRGMIDDVATKSGAMQRAWRALEVAASEAGHRPIRAEVWEAKRRDGTIVAIVRTVAETAKVIADGRHLEVWSMDEIANMLDALPPVVAAAKIAFPGAKVARSSGQMAWVAEGDEIPF